MLTALKEEAKQVFMKGDYSLAIKLYGQLHQQEPNNVRTHLKLAESKSKAGDTAGALRDYEAIANHFAENGFIVQAIAVNKIIKRINPKYHDVDEKMRLLHLERGEDWAVSAPPNSNSSPLEAIALPDLSPIDRLRLGFTRTPLLSYLLDHEVASFIDSLELRDYDANDTIYREEDIGDHLYLIAMGKVELSSTLANGKTKTFATLGESDFFGEQAFLSQIKHSSTAIAAAESTVLVIDRTTFLAWVATHPKIHAVVEQFYRERVLKRVLALTPLFEGLGDELTLALAETFVTKRYLEGETIMYEGDQGDTFYLIRSGSVLVFVNKSANPDDGYIGLGRRSEGSFFGEISLLSDKPRMATIVANEDCELMELKRKDFQSLCKRFPTILTVVEKYRDHRMKNAISALVYER